MHLRWDDLRLFVTVVHQGSLSAAARQLRVGQATLSRRIAELEEQLGEVVFERNQRGISLTAAGEKLLPAAERMAEWAHQAEQNISAHPHLPEGKVRIAAPPGIAFELLAPLSAKIRRAYPALSLEILSGLDILHLGRGEADISLRTLRPTDEDLLCIDELSVAMGAFAAPAYADTLKADVSIDQLDWICWSDSQDHLFVNQALKAMIPDFRAAFNSDDFLVQLSACWSGLGAMILPKAYHRYSILPQLKEITIPLGAEAVGSLYVVVHKRHRYLPKVQCVLDFLREEFNHVRNKTEP